jgi:hypothetical protein
VCGDPGKARSEAEVKSRILLFSVIAAALSSPAAGQNWAVGATYGSVNDVNDGLTLGGFKPSEYTVFVDYRFERDALLRFTYGSMYTEQSQSGQTVTISPGETATVPAAKERINSVAVDVSYLMFEGFFTSGLFAGIGGYQFKPQPMPPEFAAYQDLDEKVFGFRFGVDGDFRVGKHASVVLRFTYHNISAHPHRQFFNAAVGLEGKF